jgi:hypothetical protein
LSPPNDAYFNHVNVALPETPGTGANIVQIATQQYLAFYPMEYRVGATGEELAILFFYRRPMLETTRLQSLVDTSMVLPI